MIRLFVGLEVDHTIRQLLSRLGGSIPGARPVPEEQIHLTLRFIGEVDGSMYKDIRTALAGIESGPLKISIRGTGHFPPRGAPRVLWAGVEPRGDVLILRNKINHHLRLCGVEAERRKYHPHLTIARLKNSSARRVADFLAGNALLESPPFTINQVHLFSSLLTPNGAVHRIEASYPLESSAEPC